MAENKAAFPLRQSYVFRWKFVYAGSFLYYILNFE